MSSVVSSRDTVGRPASRASAAALLDTRPVFLMERCLAVRFERITDNAVDTGRDNNPPTTTTAKKPASGLATWLMWQRRASSAAAAKTPDRCSDFQNSSASIATLTAPTPAPSVVNELHDAAPAGWVYDGGFVLFQNFQEANAYCYWNPSLLDAVTSLKFVGHVTPATILLTADESCLETIRSAWARKVLRAPTSYTIALVGDVDGCAVQPISQSQFTPLPEALCWVIWELSLGQRATTLKHVTDALNDTFPDLVAPTDDVVYECLGRLIRERKIYYTGKGYGVVTPDTYRKTNVVHDVEKSLLLTNEEALTKAHGSVEAYPHGSVVDKAIQTNLIDLICRGNGTDKILYGRSSSATVAEPSEPSVVIRPRLQRHRSLRVHRNQNYKTLSWSEYKSAGSGGSLKLSPYKVEKLMDECQYATDWEDYDKHTERVPVKTIKEKSSFLSRLFRRGGQKKRSALTSFSAQFPPPEWTDGKVTHLHSVAVQTQSSDFATSSDATKKSAGVSSMSSGAVSECSTQISYSSPATTHRSLQRRLQQSGAARSESCSPFRAPLKLNTLETDTVAASTVTSISSGLGRSFSPASAHSYQRARDNRPSPTQSTDSLYSSSVGPSASAVQSPVPSVAPERTTFNRSHPARASYGGGRYTFATSQPQPTYQVTSKNVQLNQPRLQVNRTNLLDNKSTPQRPLDDYQPFQRFHALSLSYRQPTRKVSAPPLGASVPRPYVQLDKKLGSIYNADEKMAARDQFFRTPVTTLATPPLISSIMNERKLSATVDKIFADYSAPAAPAAKVNQCFKDCRVEEQKVLAYNPAGNKKFYETDLDFTIKVPKKSQSFTGNTECLADVNQSSRIINISVTKSDSIVSVQNDTVVDVNKENSDDLNHQNEKFVYKNKTNEETFRTFPSLTELNINFKSITGQKILQGLNSNSTDTLVEVNMRDAEVKSDLMSYV